MTLLTLRNLVRVLLLPHSALPVLVNEADIFVPLLVKCLHWNVHSCTRTRTGTLVCVMCEWCMRVWLRVLGTAPCLHISCFNTCTE